MTRCLVALPIILSTSFLVGVAASAQGTPIEVDMRNFKFSPSSIHLRSGQVTTLHLLNSSSSNHSFDAPAFFAASTMGSSSRAKVHSGMVEVPKQSSVDITLTPTAGRYKLKCSHFFHQTMGMSGTILVD